MSNAIPPIEPVAHTVPVVPVTPVAVAPRRSTPAWVNVALFVALAIAVGGVAFAVGRMTAPAPSFTGPGGLTGQGQFPAGAPGSGDGGQPGGPGLGGRGGFGGISVDGTVTAIDADSITIETAAGESQEIAIDDTTTVRVAASGDLGAVSVGSSVEVRVALDPGAVGQGGGTSTLTADDVTVVP